MSLAAWSQLVPESRYGVGLRWMWKHWAIPLRAAWIEFERMELDFLQNHRSSMKALEIHPILSSKPLFLWDYTFFKSSSSSSSSRIFPSAEYIITASAMVLPLKPSNYAISIDFQLVYWQLSIVRLITEELYKANYVML